MQSGVTIARLKIVQIVQIWQAKNRSCPSKNIWQDNVTSTCLLVIQALLKILHLPCFMSVSADLVGVDELLLAALSATDSLSASEASSA